MKKPANGRGGNFADYFEYLCPPPEATAPNLKHFLTTAFACSDPVVRSLLRQGKVTLGDVTRLVDALADRAKEDINQKNCVVAVEQLSGAIVGCCLAFSASSGAHVEAELTAEHEIPFLKQFYQSLFQGVSEVGKTRTPLVVVNVTTSPLFRNQGIATAMLSRLVQRVRAIGHHDAIVAVSTGNGPLDPSRPKNHQAGQLFSKFEFSPLKKIPYAKMSLEDTRLEHTGHCQAATLFMMRLSGSNSLQTIESEPEEEAEMPDHEGHHEPTEQPAPSEPVLSHPGTERLHRHRHHRPRATPSQSTEGSLDPYDRVHDHSTDVDEMHESQLDGYLEDQLWDKFS